MNELLAKLVALPRAARWAIAALLFVGVYFAIVEPALAATTTYTTRADQLRASLDRANNRAASESGVSAELKIGAARFGETVFPSADTGSGPLNKRISDVFAEQGVAAWKSDERRPANLPRDAFAGVLGPNQRAQRISIDLAFRAHPTVVNKVLAELERAPEVHAVSRVTLRKVESDEANALDANLSVETWVVARSAAR